MTDEELCLFLGLPVTSIQFVKDLKPEKRAMYERMRDFEKGWNEFAAKREEAQPGDMTWDEFEAMLVRVGWKPEDAKIERQRQEHGDLGDCDGDLGP